MGSVSVYIFLESLLLVIFIFCGYGISKGRENRFWFFGWIAVISYSLIQGLRYDRGVDYAGYKYKYENIEQITDKEWLFTKINEFLNFLGVPYYGAFIFYSFVLILSVLVLLKSYREIAMYALPIFFITTMPQSENLVRQFLAVPFVYFAVSFLMKDNLWKFLFFMLIGFLIHSSGVVLLPFL
jgi:hypothetical protein